MSKPSVPNALFQPSGKRPTPQSGPAYEVVLVTPQLAEKWLAQNTRNRNVRQNKVFGYARDMESGNWAENGETVKFAKDGTLLDGQHRLMAVTLAGVSIRMLVVTGLEPTTQETMDDGAKRTLSDALRLRGEKFPVVLAAVSRRALLWSQGYMNAKTSNQPTNTECLAFIDAHPELRDSAEVGSLLRKSTRITAAVLGFTHWLFAAIDGADAAWFFDRLSTGAGLEQYHPVWTLRKRFAEEWSAQAKLPEEYAIAFMVKGWNAYRAGDPLKILRYNPGGSLPEKFPMPK